MDTIYGPGPTPPASAPGGPRVNLALQGGGSHGAFTWGVLDTLLADGRVAFEGISGTNAGAMNAVATAVTTGKAVEASDNGLDLWWKGKFTLAAMIERFVA